MKTTQPKKRGRPVGSKKMDKLNKINSKISKNTQELLALYPAKEYLERDPETGEHVADSEATVWMINRWAKASKEIGELEPINYWKYACIAILLGIVTAMIFSTPLFVKLVEVCSQ